MMINKKWLKFIRLLVSNQYTSIGGQAVMEGVMMRSPNAFVVAVRLKDGSIKLRRDQWFSLSKKINFLKLPFLRGILILIETMCNGIVALNYSVNQFEDPAEVMDGSSAKKKEKLTDSQMDWSIVLSMASGIVLSILLFVFLPHGLTYLLTHVFTLDWQLDGVAFHLMDGIFKACIFILYIYLIGKIPDVKRVFEYHGAEHKSIATFEGKEDLVVSNAKKYTTLHPRCGTTFMFFLLFIGIILFTVIFVIFPVGLNLPPLLKHLVALLYKILLMFPIAGISYELIKVAGKYPNHFLTKIISFPGMMLQKLTTKEPDEKQLEVALCSIRAVLFLEEKYELNKAQNKILEKEEVVIKSIDEMEKTTSSLKDFLEG